MKYLKILFFVSVFALLLTLSACDVCEHEYETTSNAAACDHEVTNSKTCSKCGDSTVTVLPPTGHTYTEKLVAATCSDGGYTEYTCHCGFSYKSDITSAKGHDFLKSVTKPDCDSVGYTSYTCKTCSYFCKQDYVDPLGHALSGKMTEPDCENYGYTVYSCGLCDFSYTSDHTEPLGHVLEEVKTAPTCTDSGFTAYSCKKCDYSYDSDFVEPMGHTFTEDILSAVSCTEQGEVKYSCDCGYSYSEIIPPLGHDFEKVVVSPTVSDMGYTEFLCDCGFNYRGNYRFYSDILDNAYSGNDKVVAHGIDISRWNHTVNSSGEFEPIDWVALKAAGVDYVILKLGSTVRNGGDDGGIEPTFEMDYEGAKAAGIDVGAYFFTYSTSVSEIRKDAEYVLEWLEGNQFEYPIYLDLEDYEDEDDPDNSYKPSEIASPILTEMCLTFFSTLQKEGYYTGLYVNNEFLFNILQTENMIDLFEIWYARYPTYDYFDWNTEDLESYVWNTEKYGEHLGMWQYTMTGKLPPIVGDVDFNYAYKDYPALIKANGFNGYHYDDDVTVEFETEETESFEHEPVSETEY